jgi:DNA-binding response OmpR family regulator
MQSSATNDVSPKMSAVPGPSVTHDPFPPLEAVVSALVVSGSLANAQPIVSALTEAHFQVTVAETFEDAKARLAENPPALLLTELRLREYNGLQLVLRGKALRPTMGAIVFSNIPDPALRADAEALGATFVVKPIDSRDLIAAAVRTLLRAASGNDAAEPIRPPFERRTHDRRVQQLPTNDDRRRTERRRDPATLMADAVRRV